VDYRFQQHFKAKHGKAGSGQHCHGKSAPPCVLAAPVGTVVTDDLTGAVLADLTEEGQEVCLLRGGDGGHGNAHFKSSRNQAPDYATPGWPGEERWVRLTLKLMADAGLVGLPNAGKSSLLARSTAANPKIADYPFTTLKPQLGVVRQDWKECVVADIPGLIEGAHEGTGLGHRFLRHIERCRLLVHVIDGTQLSVVEDYALIRHELAAYSEVLLSKPEWIVINKCDQIQDVEAVIHALTDAVASVSHPVRGILAISALTGEGVPDLWRRVIQEEENVADPDGW
jgi:GTP-binding protein